MLAQVDDDTTVLVVSDHGAKRMDGGFCLNEWLWREGYLGAEDAAARRDARSRSAPWTGQRRSAWGAGGYYGRLFLNVQGREPYGIVPAADFEKMRDEIAAKLEATPDHTGKPMGTKCLRAAARVQRVQEHPA